MLDDLPHPINDSEKDLTRKERATLAQLRSGYCILLGSYKSRIKKAASLNVCSDCGKTSHDVNHLFDCQAQRTTLLPSDLRSKPMDQSRCPHIPRSPHQHFGHHLTLTRSLSIHTSNTNNSTRITVTAYT